MRKYAFFPDHETAVDFRKRYGGRVYSRHKNGHTFVQATLRLEDPAEIRVIMGFCKYFVAYKED